MFESMTYKKVFADVAVDNLYTTYGFDLDKINSGDVPNEKEFGRTIKEYYKSVSRKNEFNPEETRGQVDLLFKDMKKKVLEDQIPKTKLEKDIKDQGAKIGLLEKLLEERHDLKAELRNYPEKAAEFLREESSKMKLEVYFTKNDVVRIDRTKDFDMYLENLKKDKNSTEFKAGIRGVENAIERGNLDIIRDLKTERLKLTELQANLEQLGKTPRKEVITKPEGVSPLIDFEHAKLVLKWMDQPETTKEVVLPRPYGWLHNPNYVTDLWRVLTTKEKKIEQLYKTDIHETQKKIDDVVAALWSLNRRAVEMIPFLAGFLKAEQHLLSNIPKEHIETYTNFRKNLAKKYSPEDFKRLTQWSEEASDFMVLDPDLPGVMQSDRAKLSKFFGVVQKYREKNDLIMGKKVKMEEEKKTAEDAPTWGRVNKELGELKIMLAEARVLWNKITRETYFKQWLHGDTPIEFRINTPEKAVEAGYVKYSYVDPGKSYATIQENLNNFSQYVEEHKLAEAAKYRHDDVSYPSGDEIPTKEEGKKIIKEVMRAGDMGDYLKEIGSFISKIEGGINKYHQGIDGYLSGLMSGSSIKEASDGGCSDSVTYLRRLASYYLVMLATDRVAAPNISQKKCDELIEEAFRSDLPMQFPLVCIRKNPKVFFDYFIKSFGSSGSDSFIQEWFKMSGNKFLDPKVLNQFMKRIEPWINKEVGRQTDKEYLKQERDRLEGEVDEVMERVKSYQDEVSKYKNMAETVGKKIDQEIFSMATVSEADHEKIRELKRKREELGTKLVNLIHEKPYNEKAADKTERELNRTVKDLITTVHNVTQNEANTENLTKEINNLQHLYSSIGVKALNNIALLEDKDAYLQLKLHKLNQTEEKGMAAQDKAWLESIFPAYIWNILDNEWMKNPAGFQTHFNVNFPDYLEIHEEMEKLSGGRLYSRGLVKLEKGLKEQMQELRQRGEPISDGLKSMYSIVKTGKPLKNIGEETKKQLNNVLLGKPAKFVKEELPSESGPVDEEVDGLPSDEQESTINEREKSATLYNFSNVLAYNVAKKFAGSSVMENSELIKEQDLF